MRGKATASCVFCDYASAKDSGTDAREAVARHIVQEHISTLAYYYKHFGPSTKYSAEHIQQFVSVLQATIPAASKGEQG